MKKLQEKGKQGNSRVKFMNFEWKNIGHIIPQ